MFHLTVLYCILLGIINHLQYQTLIVPMAFFLQGYIEKGLFAFTYGAADSLVEFLHVDNLVQAHVKAGQRLLPGAGGAVS